ncbi:MAG: four helix bundle protein [Methanobacteriota archaeon]
MGHFDGNEHSTYPWGMVDCPLRDGPHVTHEFGHDKRPVYRKALDLTVQLDDIANAIPNRRPDLREQVMRASASMPFDIAEGAGEYSPADKARFYRIARRSASECVAVLDIVQRLDIRTDLTSVRTDLWQLQALLTTMVKTMNDRRR